MAKGKKYRGIYMTGVNALSEKLKENATMAQVKEVVRKNTVKLNEQMVRKAQFKGHIKNGKPVTPTGATRRSITTKIAKNGMQGKVFPTTEYSYYLEYGTRFMGAQPFVGPAYRTQKPIFLKDMQELVK